MQRSNQWIPYVLLVAALLLLAFHETGILSPLESSLGFIIAPVEQLVANITDSLSKLLFNVKDVSDLQQQVAKLEQDNEALRIENIRLREQYVVENQQLRELLNFQSENPTYSTVGGDIVEHGCEVFPCGQVLGKDTNPYLRYLIINIGSRAGIAVGMPVVSSGAALVGRIARVSPHLAYVRQINDTDNEIAALLQNSRVSGMVVGKSNGALLMTEILPDEELRENEIAITSGLGGLLPKGLILGQLESHTYQEAELFQEAVLRPAIDFHRLETVLVITDFRHPTIEDLEAE
ncbi:MAG: rod shape-determining protein MreC [Chloroflexota bacterium]|nr:rod shape-determining protein MreC [Chloroflexota bacterium]